MMTMSERMMMLEARLLAMSKRIAELDQAQQVGAASAVQVADYSNYVGPFVLGCPSAGTARVGPGYVLAPGGAWYWPGGTGSALAGTTYVTLDITMDGDVVDSASVGAYTSLASVTSSADTRRVLIGVVTTAGGKTLARVQQQRGNIYLGALPIESSAFMWPASETTAGTAKLDFSNAYSYNTDVLEADATTNDEIKVKRDGVYLVSIAAKLKIPIGPSYYVGATAKVIARKNGTDEIGDPLYLEQLNVDADAASDSHLIVQAGLSFEYDLDEDETVELWTTLDTDAEASECRLTVQYLHPQP
jgi:hypothetical protein